MKNIITLLCITVLLGSCVELPNLLPDNNGDQIDMVITEVAIPLIGINEFYSTFTVNDSIQINISLSDNNEACSDLDISVENGQILQEFYIGNVYPGLNNGSLLGNATIGTWVNKYRITERVTNPSLVCWNRHLIALNKEVYLGYRVKINSEWHYGWIHLLNNNYLSLVNKQFLFLRRVALNKNAGVSARIAE